MTGLFLLLIGCGTTEENNEANNNENSQPEESNQQIDEPEKEIKEFIPKETDVVFKDEALYNVEILEQFAENSGANGEDNESQIRVVKYVPEGVLIYELQSRYDENANQAWIDVTPDLTYFDESKLTVQEVFYNAPQQCSSVAKTVERGHYTFNECRTHWEFPLFPIVEKTLAYEDIINPNPQEETEVIAGHYYNLTDFTEELFLSKKDALEWKQSADENNQEKLDDISLRNFAKLTKYNINIEEISNHEVRVIGCEDGLCEIYTDHPLVFRGFIIPEEKIDKDTGTAVRENEAEVNKRDAEDYHSKIQSVVGNLLTDSAELIAIYEGNSTEDAKLYYDKVNGGVNLLRRIIPEDKELEASYYELLMAAEMLFNSAHQGKIYFEDENPALDMIVEDEMKPLREKLEALFAEQ
ncbi:hypothetical protein [Ornithinibacillus halotolerans]|nr:hypothetical protein [Ornithinibacillus halotolerans]